MNFNDLKIKPEQPTVPANSNNEASDDDSPESGNNVACIFPKTGIACEGLRAAPRDGQASFRRLGDGGCQGHRDGDKKKARLQAGLCEKNEQPIERPVANPAPH